MLPTFLFKSQHYQHHHCRRGGMTLVDLSVGILVLSIVSAVTVPRMSEFLKRSKIEATSQLVVQSINYLKNRAIIEGKEVTLVITDQPLGMRCAQVAMPNQPGQNFFLDLSDEAHVKELTYSGISGPNLTIDRFGNFYDTGVRVQTCQITIGDSTLSATITIRQDSIVAETSRR